MKRVFLVHGHDSNALLDLRDFVTRLGLQPIILRYEDHLGETIVEAFEKSAATCDTAIVLLTPDDLQAGDLSGREKWRARQNVILELGWFMNRFGRTGVIVVHRGEVELPSDLLGVLYLRFNASLYEVAERIRLHLQGLGLL